MFSVKDSPIPSSQRPSVVIKKRLSLAFLKVSLNFFFHFFFCFVHRRSAYTVFRHITAPFIIILAIEKALVSKCRFFFDFKIVCAFISFERQYHITIFLCAL